LKKETAFLIVLLSLASLIGLQSALVVAELPRAIRGNMFRDYLGGSIDIFTQRGGEGINSSGGTFVAGERIDLYANVTYNGDGLGNKLVVFEVRDPQGNLVLVRTAITNLTGIAAVSYLLPSESEFSGAWNVYSTVDVAGKPFFDWLSFTCITSLNPIPGDVNGDHVVDCADLGMMGSSWGASEGDPNYIPEADIDDDLTVTSTDLGILGVHWCEML